MGSMCEGRAVTLKPYSYKPVTVPKPIRPSISSEPYTFLRHAQLCSEAAARREILIQHVLAETRAGRLLRRHQGRLDDA